MGVEKYGSRALFPLGFPNFVFVKILTRISLFLSGFLCLGMYFKSILNSP